MGFSNMMIAAARSIPKSTNPVNAFLYIFLLFNHKHVVIKELLELLVDEVDGNL